MAFNRRRFLLGAGGIAAAATMGGLTGCAPGSGGGSGSGSGGGAGTLQLAWWGNPTRNKNTQDEIDAYVKANTDVKIAGQPGDFASYWDKLATQTAGGTAPDIIQMDMAYIAEYGNRDALLDLSGVDTSKFVEGTVDSGKINGKLVGINAGINSLVIMANPKIFDKAGVDVPDDTTWTWDSMMEVAAEVAKKGSAQFGLVGMIGSDASLGTWLRQQGKELFTDSGLGFDASDAQGWLEAMLKYQKAGALGSVQDISQEGSGSSAKPLAQSAFAVGNAALYLSNSNQLEAINAAAGTEMDLLRLPSLAGKAAERKAWYKASMLWSASAKTKDPDAVVKWINWWVNSTDAQAIDKAERGIPCNSELQSFITPQLSGAQQKVSKFIADIKPELGTTPIAPPPGGGKLGDVLFRYATDVMFGKSSPADAGEGFVDEMKSDLQT